MGGGELSQLEHYVALTKDNNLVHLKPPFKGLIINTNNTGTTIYKRTDNKNGKQTITLENGKNTLTDWNYGFYFNSFSMKQSQITSFDFSKYDTSKVTNMYRMFYTCTSLTSLDLSSFDTSKVTDMRNMFDGCHGLTSLDVSSFDTANVTDMFFMFRYCRSLTSLDLSNFDTTKVTTMYSMFENCSGLTSLDLSNFNTSKVTDMYRMFCNCNALTHIKCKQEFKSWCWTKQSTIYLPTAMRDGGEGQWEIVG